MRKVDNSRVKSGFTIVELSFSIAFIAILSIIVVTIISNAISSYHRGLTLNQLNTAGMDLVDDMRLAVQNSAGRSPAKECSSTYANESTVHNCEGDQGFSFVMKQRKANVRIGNQTLLSSVPVYGTFCTGKYSYVWNSGYFFNEEYAVEGASAVKVVYKIAGETNNVTVDNFKLLKIQDEDRLVCRVAAGFNPGNVNGGSYNKVTSYNSMPNELNVTSVPVDEAPADILMGNNNLAIYDLETAAPAESEGSNNMFYSVSFILGTVQGGINVKAAGNYCATPEDYATAAVENFDYCAINKFNFAAQATGG